MTTPGARTEDAPDLPDEAWLTVLAGLPKMGPRRLLALVLLYGAFGAWQRVADGSVLSDPVAVARMGRDPAALARTWVAAAAATDVRQVWEAHGGLLVAGRGHPGYPAPLRVDLEPPAVVFMRGSLDALAGPRVAVVGTRRCTRYGTEVGEQLGAELAAAGVRVVSGLALGVDGAAHRGALAAGHGAAPPIGVVASGLDVAYPRRHRALWDEVASVGLLVSESPLGAQPEAWRFPARNRIIAALAEVVVVVESRGKGGSMYTVDEALRRDIDVGAVPGPVRSAASTGTNGLLADGAAVVRDSADVLGLLGIAPPPAAPTHDARPPPDTCGRVVLRALGWEPATLDTLAARTSLELGPLSVAVAGLEADGWITSTGLWLERVGRRS